MSLYFHFPFCTRKCPYCHFFVLPADTKKASLLKEALLQEFEYRLPLFEKDLIVSIYFGGGTPSLYPEIIATLLKKCKNLHLAPSLEVTVEANPEHICCSLIDRLKEIGVNRLSIGIQSFDDHLLQVLGRHHNAKEGIQAIELTYARGLENISIDLMSEIPFQTLESFKNSLAHLSFLPISHLSLYNLTFEKQTVFFKKKSTLRPHLPSNEEGLEMLEMALKKLEEMELTRYEISAFAKEGYESTHNIGYWTYRHSIGMGPSAFSYFQGRRFQNVPHLERYLKKVANKEDPTHFNEHLSGIKALHERLAIGLRLLSGIDLSSFSLYKETLFEIASLIKEGFLEKKESSICLTKQGLLFYDSVAERLVI